MWAPRDPMELMACSKKTLQYEFPGLQKARTQWITFTIELNHIGNKLGLKTLTMLGTEL